MLLACIVPETFTALKFAIPLTVSLFPTDRLPSKEPEPENPFAISALMFNAFAFNEPFAVTLELRFNAFCTDSVLALTTFTLAVDILAFDETIKFPIVVVFVISTELPVTVIMFALPAAEIVTFAFGATLTSLLPLTIAVPAAIVKLDNKYPSPLKKLAVIKLPPLIFPAVILPVTFATPAFNVVIFVVAMFAVSVTTRLAVVVVIEAVM